MQKSDGARDVVLPPKKGGRKIRKENRHSCRKQGRRGCNTAWIPGFCFTGAVSAVSEAAMRMAVYAAGSGDLFGQAKSAMHSVYMDILGIATMAAVVCAAVCLFLMYFSKSGRTVDESRAWLKRIVVCWIALMMLGAIATYFQGIVAENDFQI